MTDIHSIYSLSIFFISLALAFAAFLFIGKKTYKKGCLPFVFISFPLGCGVFVVSFIIFVLIGLIMGIQPEETPQTNVSKPVHKHRKPVSTQEIKQREALQVKQLKAEISNLCLMPFSTVEPHYSKTRSSLLYLKKRLDLRKNDPEYRVYAKKIEEYLSRQEKSHGQWVKTNPYFAKYPDFEARAQKTGYPAAAVQELLMKIDAAMAKGDIQELDCGLGAAKANPLSWHGVGTEGKTLLMKGLTLKCAIEANAPPSGFTLLSSIDSRQLGFYTPQMGLEVRG